MYVKLSASICISCVCGRLYACHAPVVRAGGEEVGLDEGEGGHQVAQDVGAPHQWDPVVEDDGGGEPVEVVCVGQPHSMGDEPALQTVDLILVDQTLREREREHKGELCVFQRGSSHKNIHTHTRTHTRQDCVVD